MPWTSPRSTSSRSCCQPTATCPLTSGDLDRDGLWRRSASTPSRAPRSSCPAPAHRCSCSSVPVRPTSSTPNALRDAAADRRPLDGQVRRATRHPGPRDRGRRRGAGQVLTEGALLARYRYTALRPSTPRSRSRPSPSPSTGADTAVRGGRHPHRSGHEPAPRASPATSRTPARPPHGERDGRRRGRRSAPRTASRSSRSTGRSSSRCGAAACSGSTPAAPRSRAWSCSATPPRARRGATSASSARGSCTTPAASASSRPTRCTCS